MSSEFGGIVDANKTYTVSSLAEVLGREEGWILEEIIHLGCRYRKIGRIYFISGHSFKIFIETDSERWVPPSKRGKRKTNLGDEA